MNRNVIIAIVVGIIAIGFAVFAFTANTQAPTTDGATTVDTPEEQIELPAGPASEPAELTPGS
jgi:hypothetical protein